MINVCFRLGLYLKCIFRIFRMIVLLGLFIKLIYVCVNYNWYFFIFKI